MFKLTYLAATGLAAGLLVGPAGSMPSFAQGWYDIVGPQVGAVNSAKRQGVQRVGQGLDAATNVRTSTKSLASRRGKRR